MALFSGKSKGQEPVLIVKRASRMAEDKHIGGAWKVAFADMALSLMFLFFMLWLISAREVESLKMLYLGGEREELQEKELAASLPIPITSVPMPIDLAKPEQKLAAKTPASAPSDQQVLKQIRDLAQDLSLTEQVSVGQVKIGVRVVLSDRNKSVQMFERGGLTLEPRFKTLLQQMGKMIEGTDYRVLLFGHTDAAPYPSSQINLQPMSNLTLSSSRALMARWGLIQGGMSEKRILQTVGMADNMLIDAENPLSGSNRRIELFLLNKQNATALLQQYQKTMVKLDASDPFSIKKIASDG